MKRTKYFTSKNVEGNDIGGIRVWRMNARLKVEYFSDNGAGSWHDSAFNGSSNKQDKLRKQLNHITRDQARKLEPKAFRKA